MKHVLFLVSMAMMGACADGKGDDSAAATNATPNESFKGAPLVEPSGGDCPSFAKSGDKTITSDGVEREFIIRFPKDPEPGLPIVFVWHGMGDSAAGIDNGLDLQGFAREHKAIVVVPQSTDPMLITWNIIDGDADVALFDDLRTCVVRELGGDIERVSTTGFSFGALFATYLILERSDTLSAAATMSGGTNGGLGFPYKTPTAAVPSLLMFGGVNDNFSAGPIGMDFYEGTMDLSAGLQADGHFVTECDHGLGHALPMDWESAIAPWLLDHRYGETSPFGSGLDGFPAYCSIVP